MKFEPNKLVRIKKTDTYYKTHCSHYLSLLQEHKPKLITLDGCGDDLTYIKYEFKSEKDKSKFQNYFAPIDLNRDALRTRSLELVEENVVLTVGDLV